MIPAKIGYMPAALGTLLLLIVTSPASARTVDAAAIESASMEPGQFAWTQEASTSPDITVLVSLGQQRAFVYRGGALIAASTVSTGKEGKETPVGTFTILQKKVMHRSNLYNDAPMPYMQRLTWDGIAIHAGDLPGYPASHGCIRVPAEFAKKLYSLTELGAIVTVLDDGAPQMATVGAQQTAQVDLEVPQATESVQSVNGRSCVCAGRSAEP